MRFSGLAGVLAMAAISVGLNAAPASATEQIKSFSVETSSTQAGGHPNLKTSFELAKPGSPDEAQSATLDLPAGVVTIPSSVALCEVSTFDLDECPVSSQVGLVVVHAAFKGEPDQLAGTAPVYALAPADGGYGALGFVAPELGTHMTAALSIRSASDYGLRAEFGKLSQDAPLAGLAIELWGVPAASSHDPSRFPKGTPGEPAGCPGVEGAGCLSGSQPSSALETSFTLAPTTCEPKQLAARLSVTSVEDPTEPTEAQANVPATTGCDQLTFNPSLFAGLTTNVANASSGIEYSVENPLALSPNVPTPSELRIVGVTFPTEMVINTAGLESHSICGDAEAGLGEESPGACPDESLLGSFAFKTPGGDGSGSVYLGEPEGEGVYRLLLLGNGAGIELKLVAYLEAGLEGESAGLWLEDLPQLPITRYAVHLTGGADAPLITPAYCEPFELGSLFAPWDEALSQQSAEVGFSIEYGPNEGPCLGPAEDISVALSPATVPPDGASVTTVRATITDSEGAPVPRDRVKFTSSDPGQKIGHVTAVGDGTYVAEITASTTPGTSTITATDESVEPALTGTVTLTESQIAEKGPPPCPTPGAAGICRVVPGAPVVRITERPPSSSRNRRPKFHFDSVPSGVRFECRVDKRAFKPCHSPYSAPRLTPGKHRFQVRAVGVNDLVGPAAGDSFRVLGSGRRRH